MNNAISPKKTTAGKTKSSSHVFIKTAAIALAIILLLFAVVCAIIFFSFRAIYMNGIYDDGVQIVSAPSPNVLPEWSELKPVLLDINITKATTEYNVMNSEPEKDYYTKDITVIGIYYINGELIEKHLTGYTVQVEKNMLTTPGEKNITIRYTEYYGENLPTASGKIDIPVKVLADGSANPESPFEASTEAYTYKGSNIYNSWSVMYPEDYGKIAYCLNEPVYKVAQKDPDIFNVLLLGTAENDNEPSLSRNKMETAIIVSYNMKKDSVTLLSVHNTTLGVIGNKVYPLSGVYAVGGPGAVVNSVNTLFGTDIQHYVEVDIDSFLAFSDQMGGVEVNLSQEDIESLELIGVSSGDSLLTGENAEKYLTDNGNDSEGIKKTVRQRRFLLSLTKKLLTNTKFDKIRSAIADTAFVKTNMPYNMAISYLFTSGFDVNDTIFFNTFAPYGEYGKDYCFVVANESYRVYYANPDAVKIKTDTLLGYSN